VLAKKHVESMNLLAESSIGSLTMRKRAIQVEKEAKYNFQYMRKVNRRNTELLLNEIICPTQSIVDNDVKSYLLALLPQLHDIDAETRQRIFNKTIKTQEKAYALNAKKYNRNNPMLADFPSQKIKLVAQSPKELHPKTTRE